MVAVVSSLDLRFMLYIAVVMVLVEHRSMHDMADGVSSLYHGFKHDICCC